jgi:hypothetical protein
MNLQIGQGQFNNSRGLEVFCSVVSALVTSLVALNKPNGLVALMETLGALLWAESVMQRALQPDFTRIAAAML